MMIYGIHQMFRLQHKWNGLTPYSPKTRPQETKFYESNFVTWHTLWIAFENRFLGPSFINLGFTFFEETIAINLYSATSALQFNLDPVFYQFKTNL